MRTKFTLSFFDDANLMAFDLSKDFAFDFYIKDNTNWKNTLIDNMDYAISVFMNLWEQKKIMPYSFIRGVHFQESYENMPAFQAEWKAEAQTLEIRVLPGRKSVIAKLCKDKGIKDFEHSYKENHRIFHGDNWTQYIYKFTKKPIQEQQPLQTLTFNHNNIFINKNIFWNNKSIYKPSLETYNTFINEVVPQSKTYDNYVINWTDNKIGKVTLDFEATYLLTNKGNYFLEPIKPKNKNKTIKTYRVISDIWVNYILNKNINANIYLTSDKNLYQKHLTVNNIPRDLNAKQVLENKINKDNKVKSTRVIFYEPYGEKLNWLYTNINDWNDVFKYSVDSNYAPKKIYFKWRYAKLDGVLNYSNAYKFKYRINNKDFLIVGLYNPQLMADNKPIETIYNVDNIVLHFNKNKAYHFKLENTNDLKQVWVEPNTSGSFLDTLNKVDDDIKTYITYQSQHVGYMSIYLRNWEQQIYKAQDDWWDLISGSKHELLSKRYKWARTYIGEKIIQDFFTGEQEWIDAKNDMDFFFDENVVKQLTKGAWNLSSIVQNNTLIDTRDFNNIKGKESYVLIYNKQLYYLFEAKSEDLRQLEFDDELSIEQNIKQKGNFLSFEVNNYNNQIEILFKNGKSEKLAQGKNTIYWLEKINQATGKEKSILYYYIENDYANKINWMDFNYQNLEYEKALARNNLQQQQQNHATQMRKYDMQEYQNKMQLGFGIAETYLGTVSSGLKAATGALADGAMAGINAYKDFAKLGMDYAQKQEALNLERESANQNYRINMSNIQIKQLQQDNKSFEFNLIDTVIKDFKLEDRPFLVINYKPSVLDEQILNIQQSKLGFNVNLENEYITLGAKKGIIKIGNYDIINNEYKNEIDEIFSNTIFIK